MNTVVVDGKWKRLAIKEIRRGCSQRVFMIFDKPQPLSSARRRKTSSLGNDGEYDEETDHE
jgi:hypothetical protein